MLSLHGALPIYEIIVTAQKREQALIDVPAAITALGAKTVKELNLSDLSSVATQVPGFNVTSERGENAPPSFNLRGIRSEEHTSALQSLMRISYAVFCLNKKIPTKH